MFEAMMVLAAVFGISGAVAALPYVVGAIFHRIRTRREREFDYDA